MEYFKDQGDKYFAKSLGGVSRLRPVILLVPLIIVVAVVFSSSGNDGRGATMLLAAGGVVVFSMLLSMVLQKAGHGPGITVDQINRTISYKRQRTGVRKVRIQDAKDISCLTASGVFAVIFLNMKQGSRILLMQSPEQDRLKALAEELSALTSLSLNKGTLTARGEQ